VKNLAALRQEGANISTGIHGSGEDIWVLMGWLRLADQTTEHSGQCDGLLHSSAWRSWRQGLQVEGQVVLDRGAGLDGFDLERSTDVGEHGRAEGERFRVVLLPSLVLGAEIEGTGVLEVWRENDGLVSGLTRQLDTEVPRVEGDEGEIEVLGGQMLRGEGVEAVDGITEGTGIANVFPGEGREARCRQMGSVALNTAC
jgi:hypothetical protein